jgi:hypothetical protein
MNIINSLIKELSSPKNRNIMPTGGRTASELHNILLKKSLSKKIFEKKIFTLQSSDVFPNFNHILILRIFQKIYF